jgi:hypothetical protein
MKYSTVEDFMESFPHPVLPAVQGDPDYQTIHATRKFLQANSRAIDTHLGGGTLGHLGLIISEASYAMISPTTDEEPTLWVTPNSPGRAPATTDGTSAQISAARHIWEEDVQTYRTCTSVQQALKKKIISVFEPMYLDILNENMVGYANISSRGMLDHLFETYGMNQGYHRAAFKPGNGPSYTTRISSSPFGTQKNMVSDFTKTTSKCPRLNTLFSFSLTRALSKWFFSALCGLLYEGGNGGSNHRGVPSLICVLDSEGHNLHPTFTRINH